MKNKFFVYFGFALLILLFINACNNSSDESDVIEVTFDGKSCTVSGPSELPAGDHTFKFIDLSKWEGELYVVYLHEGKTIQDHLDYQGSPGVWKPRPEWIDYNTVVRRETKESGERRIDTETWRLNKVGEHNVFCYVDDPRQLWLAVPLMIVETPTK